MPIITAADLDIPEFCPRFPWWGGDLQTLRNTIHYTEPDFAPYPATRLTFDLPDGDRMLALLNRPASPTDNPAVMLIHGLTGCEDSRNIKRSAAFYLAHGFPVIRLNLRGAGPSAQTCRHHYHAGRSDDLGLVIDLLPPHIKSAGLFLVGTSLGGNILLKFLAERGSDASILAAGAVSPPIDLKSAQQRIMAPRNALYHWHLLRHMKAGLTPREDGVDLNAIRTVYDFDDLVIAPVNGFAGADDYYRRCSAAVLLDDIAIPTLIVHPRNDPWIPTGPLTSAQRSPMVNVILPASGGHIGFHGTGEDWPWHNRCLLAHFRRQFDVRVANMHYCGE